MQRIIAITGATGFIGSHLTQLLARSGWHVRLLCRRFPLHPLWENSKFEVIIGDLTDDLALQRLVHGAQVVIHGAGIVKTVKAQDFFKINASLTNNLADIVLQQAPTSHFIFLSSLAARESLSVYGQSKKKAEDFLKTKPLYCSIVRPPAVYGEFDGEIFPIIKLLQHGLGLILGGTKARFALIHAADLSSFIKYLAEQNTPPFNIYEPCDAQKEGYGWVEFLEKLKRVLHKKHYIPIRLNRHLLKFYYGLQWLYQKLDPKFVNILSHGKIDEILHPNWLCDVNTMPPNWQPALTLEQGLTRTITGYRTAGWL